MIDGKKITSKVQIANEFNDFFSNVGINLARKIEKQNCYCQLPVFNNKTFYLDPISSSEINKTIFELPDKSGGVDKINTKVLKNIAYYIASPLEHIFNLCISKGFWPTSLKSAEVVPMFKSGNRYLSTNYRPISLISNIAKIFEKLIHHRISKFLKKCNLLSDKQYGFRKEKGTNNALSFVSNLIHTNMNNDVPIIATFLDLQKAFDTVNFNILFKKLYRYGIRGMALDLLKDYLTNRIQRVRVDNI